MINVKNMVLPDRGVTVLFCFCKRRKILAMKGIQRNKGKENLTRSEKAKMDMRLRILVRAGHFLTETSMRIIQLVLSSSSGSIRYWVENIKKLGAETRVIMPRYAFFSVLYAVLNARNMISNARYEIKILLNKRPKSIELKKSPTK